VGAVGTPVAKLIANMSRNFPCGRTCRRRSGRSFGRHPERRRLYGYRIEHGINYGLVHVWPEAAAPCGRAQVTIVTDVDSQKLIDMFVNRRGSTARHIERRRRTDLCDDLRIVLFLRTARKPTNVLANLGAVFSRLCGPDRDLRQDGIENINSDFATFIRTIVIVIVTAGILAGLASFSL